MSSQHPQDLLLAHLDDGLPAAAAEEVARHLEGCAECARESEELAAARALLAPLRAAEPRPGFAARVAREAGGRESQAAGAPWWRWAAGGALALASLAALALIGVGPRRGADRSSDDLRMARRLELYEDMSVLQHQEALEDLEVVEVLHTLQPEARP